MKYVKNTSKIILSSLISMHCYGMEPQKESDKTIEDMLKFFQAMNAAGGNDLLTSLRPPTNKSASNTAYFKAIESGDLETVKRLYKNTPQFLKQQDWSGFNALHVAAEAGRLNIVEFLMNNDKDSLLQIPVGMGAYPIHMAAKKNNLSIVKFMCEKNDIIGTQKDSRTGGNSLHMATANKATATVDYLMKNYPELLNEQDLSKNFPHQLALATGQKELAKSMIIARLELSQKTKNATTISVAANSQNPEQLTKKPSKQSKNQIEAVPSQNPFYNNEGPNWTPFFRAVISGDLERVKKLYNTNYPSILNQPDYPGFNALHAAIDLGHLNIVEFLMDNDKDSGLQTAVAGFYPIHAAAKDNHHSIVKFMCEKNKNFIKQKETYSGRMANVLHVAAGNGAKETVNYLMTNYPELLNEQDKSKEFPHQSAIREGHKELARFMNEARLKLSEQTKNVSVAANSKSPEQLTEQPSQQPKRNAQKKQAKNHKKSPKMAQEKKLELVESKTVLPVQKAAPSQPMENLVPVIAQETPVYTRMGLKKINVEGVKAIYEKTLVKGEIYEANPNKEKMITHILKHQNDAKPGAKKEVPQIVLSDAERFANENTSLTLFDIPKEKPKRKIRIENPLKKLSKRAEDWKARRIETPEEKATRKMLRNQMKVKDSHPEGIAFETSSVSQSFDDMKSHFSMTDSESQSTKSLVSESEGGLDGINLEMKLSYPQLFRLLKKENAQNISEVKFKSSNIIRATLTLMQKLGFIDGTVGTANIHVTRKNSTDAFVSHITHGSGKYAKWYHNPAIVVNFFDFIAKCDPVIAEYLNSVFEEKYISKDTPKVNDAKKPTDNAPNEAGED